MLRSAEAAECGLACAAMVAAYHGRRIDLNSLRRTSPVSMAGMTLKGLGRILDTLGLLHRAIRLELVALKRLPTPAILHWDMNHFVVLTGWSGGKAVINDPEAGTRTINLEELSRRFTGVAVEVAAHGEWKGPDTRVRVRLSSLWSSAAGLWSSFGQIAILTICLQLIAVALPLQLQLIIDQAIPANDTGLLLTISFAFAGIFFVNFLIQALRDWTLQIVGAQFSYQLIR